MPDLSHLVRAGAIVVAVIGLQATKDKSSSYDWSASVMCRVLGQSKLRSSTKANFVEPSIMKELMANKVMRTAIASLSGPVQVEFVRTSEEGKKVFQARFSSRALSSGDIWSVDDVETKLSDWLSKKGHYGALAADVIESVSMAVDASANNSTPISTDGPPSIDSNTSPIRNEVLRGRLFPSPSTKKRGRPKSTIDELNMRLRKAQKKVCRMRVTIAEQRSLLSRSELADMNDDEDANDDEEEADAQSAESSSVRTTSELLVKLIERSGVYREARVSRNQPGSLKIQTGCMASELHSSCLVSYEKMPHVVLTVAHMLFGRLTLEATEHINAASSSYSDAALDYVEAQRAEHAAWFKGTGSVFNALLDKAWLAMDESNKADRALKVKIYVYMNSVGKIGMKGFNTDQCMTKKVNLSIPLTWQSLQDEIGNGVVLLHGATCDWFANGMEAREIMKLVDGVAATCDRALVQRVSVLFDDLVYNYDGPFRQLRIRPCHAHNEERIFAAFLLSLLQQAGLKNDATTSQAMYRIYYYMDKKFYFFYRQILFMAYDGNDALIPKVLKNKFGNTAANRWLSCEKQAALLIEMLKVPATPAMVELLRHKIRSKDWEIIQTTAVCWDDEKQLSMYCLILMYLVNSVPGGPQGEGRAALTRIVAALCSNEHRISISIVAAILPLHRSFLAFTNSKSEVVDAQVIGTRVIETSVFSRNLLGQVAALQTDWKSALPSAFSDMTMLSARLPSNEIQPCRDRWTSKMDQATLSMMPTAVKYFRDMDLEVGWSIVLLTDPVIAPCVAKGILLGLHHLSIIVLSQERLIFLNEPVLPPAIAINACWTPNSTTHAYPDLTFVETTKRVSDSITNNVIGSKAIAKAYAMGDRRMVDDLYLFAQGGLRSLLESQLPKTWAVGQPVAKYFPLLAKTFPVFADCMKANFSVVCVQSTIVEQTISNARNQISPNKCASSNAAAIYYATSVRGDAVRSLFPVPTRPSGNGHNVRGRHVRSAQSRHACSELLLINAAGLSKRKRDPSPNKRLGKKVFERNAMGVHAVAEMDKNSNVGAMIIGGTELANFTKAFDSSKRIESVELGDISVTVGIKAMQLNVNQLKAYLGLYNVACTGLPKQAGGRCLVSEVEALCLTNEQAKTALFAIQKVIATARPLAAATAAAVVVVVAAQQ